MNEINFLNSMSEKNHISFYRWSKITFFLFLLIVFSISILQIKQIYRINLLKKEKRNLEEKLINFDDFVNEKNKIKEYRAEMEKQLIKFQKISSATFRTFAFNFLNELVKNVSEDLYLQNFEFDSKKGITLKGYSTAIHTVNIFVQKLNKISFIENAKIEYLKFKDYELKDNENIETENVATLHEFLINIKVKK